MKGCLASGIRSFGIPYRTQSIEEDHGEKKWKKVGYLTGFKVPGTNASSGEIRSLSE